MKTGMGTRDIVLGATHNGSLMFYDGIVQALDKAGWRVHLIADGGTLGHARFKDKARLHLFPIERGIAPGRDLVSLLRWMRALAKIRPNRLIVGTPKASLLGCIAGRVLRVPTIVYVAHGFRAEHETGLKGKILSAIERSTLHLAHRTLAVSPSLKMALSERFPEIENRIDVVSFGGINGVDTDRFQPVSEEHKLAIRAKLNIPKDAFLIGYLGRMEKDKGTGFLLDVIERLDDLNIHVLLIGDLDDPTLTTRFERLNARGRLTHLDWLPDPENVVSAVDVLAHPTRREGLGVVLLEAQAMEIPVLTNRVTGTVDAVADGVGGFFAELDSVHDWSEKIRMLEASPQERRDLGHRGRQFVEERFSKRVLVPQVVDYLLGQPTPRVAVPQT